MGLQLSESLTEAGGSTFKVLMDVKLVLAVDGKTSFPLHVGLSSGLLECLHSMETGFPE